MTFGYFGMEGKSRPEKQKPRNLKKKKKHKHKIAKQSRRINRGK